MQKRKILILGGTGIIADNFSNNYGHKFKILKTHFRNPKKNSIFFDVKRNSIDTIIDKYKPAVIIYAAGISDHNYCAKNKTESRLTNVLANKKQISKIIKKNIKIIFLSTQLVYSGNRGAYAETDKPYPILEYSKQKLELENYITKHTKNYLILRLSKIIGLTDNKKDPINYFINDLNKKKKLKLADDQISNYLYVDDLNKILAESILKNICGLFNVGGSKPTSRYDFFQNFLNKFQPSDIKKIEKCKINEINFYEKQPKDTSVQLSKLKKFFITRTTSYKEFNKILASKLNTNQNVLVIGCGFFSQNIYLPILKYFFKREQIFVYDERPNLKKKVSKFFGYNYLNDVSRKELKKNKIKICFLCYERTRSFYYVKKILDSGIHLFGEKPICDSYRDLKYLYNLSKINKLIFDGSFQRLFEKKIIEVKNKINYSKPIKLECFFSSGNFRHNKKTLVRTNEKILTIKKKKNLNIVSYLIFLNRYWHILNTVNYLTGYTNLKRNKIKFIKYDMYTYSLVITNRNLEIKFYLNSKKTKGWHEKYIIKNTNSKITFNLDAPMKFSKKNYDKTTFYLQIKNFINSIKMLKNDRIKQFSKELKFIEKIWNKSV